jgi:hypothetical protein
VNKGMQIACDIVLYGFLPWFLYDSTIKELDPRFAARCRPYED